MVLTIGGLRLDPPVVLAPMAGVTNAAFRTLCRAHGGGLFVSEMVMARALLETNERTQRMVSFGPDESPRSVQLYTVDPRVTGLAAPFVDGIDGDHGNVIGVSLPLLRALLAEVGIELTALWS